VPPQTAYLVCMVQRCGSNALCEALSRTGVAGRPTEYFTPAFPRASALGHTMAGFEHSAWARERGADCLRNFISVVIREGSTPNGVFGAKLPWNALDAFLGKLRAPSNSTDLTPIELLNTTLGPVKFVRVQRHDRLRQAVSWALAAQTGLYSSHEAASRAPTREPAFDFQLVDGFLGEIERSERGWDLFFESSASEPLQLFYEELDEDLEGTVRRALEWICVPAPAEIDLSNLRHQRQAGSLNAEWVQRYLALRRGPAA
jgi:trehalose 2-sulfotransferase